MNPGMTQLEIIRVEGSARSDKVKDFLAVEEPLEIRVGLETKTQLRESRSISITMRTPGNDFELAAGFLFTEGIIHSAASIKEIKHCGTSLSPYSNTLKVELNDGVEIDFKRLERNFYTTSSCGVCGKSSLEALKVQRPPSKKPSDTEPLKISMDTIYSLPKKLRAAQENFNSTGGLHASALFSVNGELLTIREDVGRHNALDKVIGKALLDGQLPLRKTILLLSGRASFELLQKASMAEIPILVAVGAPSSLAVECAKEFGITLLGFLKNESFNIYTGAEVFFS